MVVAVQCPAEKCRKFMLVEDHERGNVVHCLLCRTPIRVTGPPQITVDRPPIPPPSPPGAVSEST